MEMVSLKCTLCLGLDFASCTDVCSTVTINAPAVYATVLTLICTN